MTTFNTEQQYTHVCVDGDVLVYWGAFKADYGREEQECASMDFNKVLSPVISVLQDLIDNTLCTRLTVYFSDSNRNFRNAIATLPGPGGQGYKANRKTSKKPYHYTKIKTWLWDHCTCNVVSCWEADDSALFNATRIPNSLIVTTDKDLLVYEWDVYDWTKDVLHRYMPVFELRNMNKKLYARGIKWFYAQMLLGDTGDNIPGIPKIGPVKAYKLLLEAHTEDEWFEIVKKEYQRHYEFYWKEAMIEIGQLLWIKQFQCVNIVGHWESEQWV